MNTRTTRLVAFIAGVFVLLALLPAIPAGAGSAWGCHFEGDNPAPTCDFPPKPACTQIGETPAAFALGVGGCKWVQFNGGVSVVWSLPIPYDHCVVGPDGFFSNTPCFDWALGAGVGVPMSGVYSVEPTDKPYIGRAWFAFWTLLAGAVAVTLARREFAVRR